jgi:hypothetical protein
MSDICEFEGLVSADSVGNGDRLGRTEMMLSYNQPSDSPRMLMTQQLTVIAAPPMHVYNMDNRLGMHGGYCCRTGRGCESRHSGVPALMIDEIDGITLNARKFFEGVILVCSGSRQYLIPVNRISADL